MELIYSKGTDYAIQDEIFTKTPSGFLFNSPNPTIGISGNRLYISSVKASKGRKNTNLEEREAIEKFSEGSKYRMVRYLRECNRSFKTFLTLTYESDVDGRQAKRDIKVFIQRLRYIFRNNKRSISGFWFIEFTKKGRPHYHIFFSHYIDRRLLSATWNNIIKGTEKHLKAGTNIVSFKNGRRGIIAYAVKYAAKSYQKEVPKDFGWVGRFWGKFGDTSVTAVSVKWNIIHQKSYNCYDILEKIGQMLVNVKINKNVKVAEMLFDNDNTRLIMYDIMEPTLLRYIHLFFKRIGIVDGEYEW